MANVEVEALRPHVERERREVGDRYYVTEQRADYLASQDPPWAKRVSEIEAEAEAAADAEAKAEAKVEAAEAEELSGLPLDELVARWDKSMSPEDYIERYPDAKAAKLARAIIEKTQAEAG